MANGADTLSVSALVAAAPLASATLNVSEALAARVGVPAIVPVEAGSARPAGRVPDARLQVSAPLPPLASSFAEYAAPTAPAGREAVVIVMFAPPTVSVRVFVAVAPPASATLNVSEALAAAVGVPAIVPV